MKSVIIHISLFMYTESLSLKKTIMDTDFDALYQRYFELSFLLKAEMHSIEAFKYVDKTTNESLTFLSKLDKLASSLGILRGTLSRALLPFDTNTNVRDQANISDSDNKNIKEVLNGIDIETQNGMRSSAINMRQLVKIKIADDADLDQCKQALLTVKSFCSNLIQFCKNNKTDLSATLIKLEAKCRKSIVDHQQKHISTHSIKF